MALTLGSGPFGERSAGAFNFEVTAPRDHALYLEDSPRRVRVVFGGETVADSRRVKLLHETGHLPVYYFPEEDVRMDLLEATDHTTHCPFKGNASYWSVKAGDRVAENAVWGYPEPLESFPPIAGHLAFYWDAMDAWFEEDEEIFVHPRDPYHRVDVLESSRHVKVSVNGEVVAETAPVPQEPHGHGLRLAVGAHGGHPRDLLVPQPPLRAAPGLGRGVEHRRDSFPAVSPGPGSLLDRDDLRTGVEALAPYGYSSTPVRMVIFHPPSTFE